MKVNFTSEKPAFKRKRRSSKYIKLVDEFINSADPYLVFKLDPEDNIHSLSNSLHAGIKRRGYTNLIVHSNKNENIVYLEKVSK